MTELLVLIVLSVCPVIEVDTISRCQENLINCAVRRGGKIDETSIKECIEELGL